MKSFDRFLSASGTLLVRISVSAVALIALAALTPPANAQDSAPSTSSSSGTGAASTTSTPARRPARKPFRAARLTYIEGQVRVEQANSSANSVPVINMPLVEGTVISSGDDGQAEIEFEDGSVARLTPNSGLSLLNLSVDSSGAFQTRIALLGGLAYFELRAGTKYIYAVDVHGNVISPVENVTFRVSFDEPPATVAVIDGTAHLTTADKSSVDATAGQTVELDTASNDSVLVLKSAITPETWDRWNEDRDQTAATEANAQTDARTKFAGNQGYGWSDLDANGTWYDVPGHGKVWQPDLAATPDGSGPTVDMANGQNAAPDSGQNADQSGDQSIDPNADQATADNGDFDPYGYGSWAWTSAGYAWASGYGWGWLPFRCGLWSYYGGFGWGWSPDSYCGAFGFGGFGYGGSNFGTLPRGYKRPHRPIPGPGPIHPILRARGGPVPVAPVHRPGTERVIAGIVSEPLEVSIFTERSSGTVGAALRRDYPIDAKTHEPATGLIAPTHAPAAASNARAAWQPVGPATGNSRSVYVPQRPAYGQDSTRGNRPAPVIRPAPVQSQRPTSTPAPRSSPPPASHPSSPPAASSAAPKGK